MFFDKIAPGQQLFYAGGLILIVRHIHKHHVEIVVHVQLLGFAGFYDAVDDGAGRRSLLRSMEKRLLASDGIAFCPPFRRVV